MKSANVSSLSVECKQTKTTRRLTTDAAKREGDRESGERVLIYLCLFFVVWRRTDDRPVSKTSVKKRLKHTGRERGKGNSSVAEKSKKKSSRRASLPSVKACLLLGRKRRHNLLRGLNKTHRHTRQTKARMTSKFGRYLSSPYKNFRADVRTPQPAGRLPARTSLSALFPTQALPCSVSFFLLKKETTLTKRQDKEMTMQPHETTRWKPPKKSSSLLPHDAVCLLSLKSIDGHHSLSTGRDSCVLPDLQEALCLLAAYPFPPHTLHGSRPLVYGDATGVSVFLIQEGRSVARGEKRASLACASPRRTAWGVANGEDKRTCLCFGKILREAIEKRSHVLFPSFLPAPSDLVILPSRVARESQALFRFPRVILQAS